MIDIQEKTLCKIIQLFTQSENVKFISSDTNYSTYKIDSIHYYIICKEVNQTNLYFIFKSDLAKSLNISALYQFAYSLADYMFEIKRVENKYMCISKERNLQSSMCILIDILADKVEDEISQTISNSYIF